MTLARYPGETLKQYSARTGLETWATEAQHRVELREFCRNYARTHNSPRVVAWLERAWKKLDEDGDGCDGRL